MGEALTQVKSVLGSDAVILHTRTFQIRKWFRSYEMVEVTAGKGFNIGARKPRASASPAPAPARPNAPIAGTYSKQSIAPRNAIEGGKQILETPVAQSAALLGLTQEMTSLKTLITDLISQHRAKQHPQIPEEMFGYYESLLAAELSPELATEIIRNIHRQSRAEHLQQPNYVREKMAEHLEKLAPTAGAITRGNKPGPHIVALIGPTGVGKTTTIAKLAAILQLRDKHRVGLITLDTYRIAAVEQLKRYSDILGCPLRVVNGTDDLREAMKSMAGVDFILIDTAGRSPNDTMKLNELKTFLTIAAPDEVHLVLSSTASSECLQLAMDKFGNVRVDRVIFTKIDEAAKVGVVLNTLRKMNKSLSYITTGQGVPDDIEVGHGRRLAQLILGGPL